MADMGVYLAFDVDYISMIPTGGELVACRHSVKVDDEDLAGAYELIRKLYQEVRIERDNLKQENAKLRELAHENKNLRALVRDMFEEIEAGGFDPMVERHGKSTVYYVEDPSWRVGIRERVRELGIEVDE